MCILADTHKVGVRFQYDFIDVVYKRLEMSTRKHDFINMQIQVILETSKTKQKLKNRRVKTLNWITI